MKKLEELGISPAPWEVRILHWNKNRVDGIEDANGETIVETDSGVYPPKLPDARMLAAAPKMYAALWELIEACGEVGYKDGGTAACYESEHHLYDVIDRAKAALAEASGESEVRDGE